MTAPPIAVITGGHPFTVPPFHAMVRRVCGERFTPCVQHLEDFATSSPEIRRGYAAALFYFFPPGRPEDGGPSGQPMMAIEDLLDAGQGIVVLHHALLAYAAWPTWDEVVGCSGRGAFSYHPAQRVAVAIAEPRHPITVGAVGWEMDDEIYVMPPPAGAPLLRVDHPRSMPVIGWTRTCRRSRVVCLQSGHDAGAWEAAGFQTVLSGALDWVAQRRAV